MPHKAVVSLITGLEDPEKVTVAFLVAVGAAEEGPRDTDVSDQGGPCGWRPTVLGSELRALVVRRYRTSWPGSR
jgi:hypothetical protein